MRPARTASAALLALLLTAPATAGIAEAAAAPAPPRLAVAADGPAAAALLSTWTTASPVTLTRTAATAAALTVADRPTASPSTTTTIRVARSAVSIVTAVPDPASGRLLTGLTVDRLLLADLYSGDPVTARNRLAELNPGRALPARLTGCTTATDPEETQAVAEYTGLSKLASSCRYPDTANLMEAFAPGRRAGAPDRSTGFVGYAPTVLAAPADVPAAAVSGPAGHILPNQSGYPISTPLTAALTPPGQAGTVALATLLSWVAGPGQLALAPGLLPLTSSERAALQAAATSLKASSSAPTAGSSSPAVIAGSSSAGGPVPGPSPASTSSPTPAAQAPARRPAPAPQPPAPAVQPPLAADLAALGRPPVGLTGSGLTGTAPLAVRLTGQPAGLFAGNAWLDQVPAPLLAPALAPTTPSRRYDARAATVSRPTYDLLPGLVAGLLAGVVFLCCVRYVRPSRVGPPSPVRPRRRAIRFGPVRVAGGFTCRLIAASSSSVRRVAARRSSRPLPVSSSGSDAVRGPAVVDIRDEAHAPLAHLQVSPVTWSTWQPSGLTAIVTGAENAQDSA